MSGVPRAPSPLSGLAAALNSTLSTKPVYNHGDIICTIATTERDIVLKRGSVVRLQNGDVGDVVWAGQRPSFYAAGHTRSLADIYVKVNVWRLGSAMLVTGDRITLMEDDDHAGRADEAS